MRECLLDHRLCFDDGPTSCRCASSWGSACEATRSTASPYYQPRCGSFPGATGSSLLGNLPYLEGSWPMACVQPPQAHSCARTRDSKRSGGVCTCLPALAAAVYHNSYPMVGRTFARLKSFINGFFKTAHPKSKGDFSSRPLVSEP